MTFESDGAPFGSTGTKKVDLVPVNTKKKGKKKMKGQKSTKPPKGTVHNPHKVRPFISDISEFKEGVTEFWVIQEQVKKNSKWKDEADYSDSLFASYKSAQAAIKEIQQEVVDRQQWEWERQNQVTTRPFRFYVTQATTENEVEDAIKELKKTFEKSRPKKGKEKPTFTVPEYPKYRAVRRTVTVKTEEPVNGS